MSSSERKSDVRRDGRLPVRWSVVFGPVYLMCLRIHEGLRRQSITARTTTVSPSKV